MFKLALDAGHGYNTAGKRCDVKIDPKQTREWTLNARICDNIEELLKAYEGYEVLRVDDVTGKTDVPMATRTANANKFKADLYLSIHHNAGINGGSGGGIVVFTWNNPDEQLKEWQKMFYDALIRETGLKGNRAQPLAKENFNVLVNTNMQAILIEHGFMDSTTDVPIILSEDFANKVAKAHVETIAKIGGLTKKKVTQPAETKKLYRVQVGAFSVKENAERMKTKLKADGYDAFIVEVNA